MTARHEVLPLGLLLLLSGLPLFAVDDLALDPGLLLVLCVFCSQERLVARDLLALHPLLELVAVLDQRLLAFSQTPDAVFVCAPCRLLELLAVLRNPVAEVGGLLAQPIQCIGGLLAAPARALTLVL